MATWEISDILEMLKSKVRRSAQRLEEMGQNRLADMVLTLNEEIDDIIQSSRRPSPTPSVDPMTPDGERRDYERWKEEILTGQEKAVERSDIRRGLSFD